MTTPGAARAGEQWLQSRRRDPLLINVAPPLRGTWRHTAAEFASRKWEGSLPFRAGLRGEMLLVRVGSVADSLKGAHALT
jgi:hypothetical protein